MNPKEFLERVKARCAAHRGPTPGFCAQCFEHELQDVLCEEHADLKRGDLFKLIHEWLAREAPLQ